MQEDQANELQQAFQKIGSEMDNIIEPNTTRTAKKEENSLFLTQERKKIFQKSAA